MAAIVGFLVLHVTLALIVPKTLVNMLTGGSDLSGKTPAHPEPQAHRRGNLGS